MKPQQDVENHTDAALLRQSLVAESNAALRIGALCAAIPAFTGGVFLPFWAQPGQAGPRIAWMFCLLCLMASGVLHLLASAERVRGWVAYAVLVPIASLPTGYFLLCHALLPSGAAASIHGPIPYLYFVTLVLTGLVFDFRLTALASVLAAAGFEYCLSLARPPVGSAYAADPLLLQAITHPSHGGFKSLMILSGGLLVAALAWVARRLIVRVLDADRAEYFWSRLFGRYASAQVKARLLLTSRSEIGERREVVVLFASLRGFTEYSESAAPQELVTRLNTYLEAMVRAITLRGGVIDKFIGDAVVATFGGLVDLQAPCAVALEAAREMRTRLELLNLRWESQGRVPFDNGIGLHVGQVVLGAIGSEQRQDFTVLGDTVTTASRVESLTQEYGHPILLTRAFHERLPASMKPQCKSLGTVQVTGLRAPLELYGVPEGPSAVRTLTTRDAPRRRDVPVTWE